MQQVHIADKRGKSEVTEDPASVHNRCHRLFLDNDEILIKDKNVAGALEWSKRKQTKLEMKVSNNYPVTRTRRTKEILRLKSRHGLLETLRHLSEESEHLERTAWSFRTFFPSIEAAVKEFEEQIATERKYVDNSEEAVEVAEKSAEHQNKRAKLKYSLLEEYGRTELLRLVNELLALPADEQQGPKGVDILTTIKTLESQQEIPYIRSFSNIYQKTQVSLKEQRENLVLIKKDAEKRIEKIKTRIQFIKDYPELFIIPPVDHYTMQGVRFTSSRAICFDDPITNELTNISEPGAGTIVTVVDNNNDQLEDEPIHPALKDKMVNPEGSAGQWILNPLAKGGHGHATSVASVICLETNNIGLARSSRIQLIGHVFARAKSYRGAESSGLSVNPVYHEQYYYGLLDGFVRDERVVFRGKETVYLCAEREDQSELKGKDQSDLRETPMEKCLPSVEGNIINYSAGFQDVINFLPKNDEEGSIEQYFFWWYQLSVKRKLLVMSAGNESLNAGSGFMYRFMKVFASHPSTRHNFIMVTNLNIDGLHPYPSSTLPGRHLGLQSRTVSAIGTEIDGLMNWPQDSVATTKEIGTSFSAPFISATAAIIEGQFPNLSVAQIGECILDSATPIILFGENSSFFQPVALDMMSYQLYKPGIYRDTLGEEREVTQEMIKRGQETYGHGRVHVERALKLASLVSKSIDYKDGPPMT